MAMSEEQRMQEEIDEAYELADFDRANALKQIQAEQNRIRNQQIDNQNMQLNNMFLVAPWAGIDFSKAGKPGQVITTNTTGDIIKFRKFVQSMDMGVDDAEEYKKKQELDERRQIKIFAHFADLFVKRFPNWELRPDPANPFKRLAIANKKRNYQIISGYPSNEIQIHGVPTENSDKVDRFTKRHGIPAQIFKTGPETVPFQNFYAWALGIEDDLPKWVKDE